MYRRPKFLEILIDVRQEMAAEADYDVELFAELARSGKRPEPRVRIVSRSTDEPIDGSAPIRKSSVLRRPVSKK